MRFWRGRRRSSNRKTTLSVSLQNESFLKDRSQSPPKYPDDAYEFPPDIKAKWNTAKESKFEVGKMEEFYTLYCNKYVSEKSAITTKTGHPKDFLNHLQTDVESAYYSISKDLKLMAKTNALKVSNFDLDVLRCLTLASALPPNSVILQRTCISLWLVKLTRMACQHYNLRVHNSSAQRDSILIYLERLLAMCFRACALICDPQCFWMRNPAPERAPFRSDIFGPIIDNATQIIASLTPTVKRPSTHRSELCLLHSTLMLAGTLAHGSPDIQTELVKKGCHQMVLKLMDRDCTGLAAKRDILDTGECRHHEGKSKMSVLWNQWTLWEKQEFLVPMNSNRAHLSSQLLCVHLLHVLADAQTDVCAVLARKGFQKKLLRFLSWASLAFTSSPSSFPSSPSYSSSSWKFPDPTSRTKFVDVHTSSTPLSPNSSTPTIPLPPNVTSQRDKGKNSGLLSQGSLLSPMKTLYLRTSQKVKSISTVCNLNLAVDDLEFTLHLPGPLCSAELKSIFSHLFAIIIVGRYHWPNSRNQKQPDQKQQHSSRSSTDDIRLKKTSLGSTSVDASFQHHLLKSLKSVFVTNVINHTSISGLVLRFYSLCLLDQALKTRPELSTAYQSLHISQTLLSFTLVGLHTSPSPSLQRTRSKGEMQGDIKTQSNESKGLKEEHVRKFTQMLKFNVFQFVLECSIVSAQLHIPPVEMRDLLSVIETSWIAMDPDHSGPSLPSCKPRKKRRDIASRRKSRQRINTSTFRADEPLELEPAELAAVSIVIFLDITKDNLRHISAYRNVTDGIWKSLYRIMEAQRVGSEEDAMILQPQWTRRVMVLQVLASMVQSEELRTNMLLFFYDMTLEGEPTNPTSFLTQLLQEHNKPVRQFALSLFVQTIKNRVTREAQETTKAIQTVREALIVDFMSTFHTPVVQQDRELSSITMLLGCMRKIIVGGGGGDDDDDPAYEDDDQNNTNCKPKVQYQNLFRKKGCFIHIVNLLSHIMPHEPPHYANRRGKNYLNYQRRQYMNRHRKKVKSMDNSGLPITQTPKESPATAGNGVFQLDEKENKALEVTNQVLRTLILLMKDNAKNQRYFKREIFGYKQLQTILIHFVDTKQSRQLYHTLFDFLVMGTFCPVHNSTIKNSDIIPVMFDMLPARSIPEQAEFLECFMSIVSKSLLNRELCCRANLIDMLLEMLPYMSTVTLTVRTKVNQCRCMRASSESLLSPTNSKTLKAALRDTTNSLQTRAIEFIQILGTHSITVPQLKKLFRVMKSVDTLTRKLGGSSARASPLITPSQSMDESGVDRKETSYDNKSAVSSLHKKDNSCDSKGPVVEGLNNNSSSPDSLSLLAEGGSPKVIMRAGGSASSSTLTRVTSKEEVGSLQVVSTRPSYNPLILAAIERMFLRTGTCAPDNYWVLEGTRSGMVLPPIHKWPKHGFGVSLWIRLGGTGAGIPHRRVRKKGKSSSNEAGRAEMNQNARLFSIKAKDKNKESLEILLTDQTVRIHLKYSDDTEIFLPAESERISQRILEPKLWYNIVVSFSRSKQGSVLQVVNGLPFECKSFGRVKYPQIANNSSECFLGTDGDGNSFCGLLGPVYMFKEALTEVEAEKIWRLGPKAIYSYQDEDPVAVAISKKVMRAYNAKANTSTGFVDNAPLEQKLSTSYDTTAKAIQPGTHACVTRHIKDIIHCLGGIQVLFPICEQLDQPVRCPRQQIDAVVKDGRICDVVAAGRGRGGGGEEMRVVRGGRREDIDPDTDSSDEEYRYLHVIYHVNYEPDPDFVCRILRLMRIMISRDATNEVFMRRHKGFALLAFILEKLSPLNLTQKVVLEIDHLVIAMSNKPDMALSGYWNLMANVKLWMFAPQETQHTWITLLQDKDKVFQADEDSLAVQKLVDQLRTGCWYEPEQGAVGVSSFYHPITGELMGQRTSKRTTVAGIRFVLLKFIRKRLGAKSANLHDLKSMLYFLELSKDNDQRSEILRLLIRLIKSKPQEFVSLCRKLEFHQRQAMLRSDAAPWFFSLSSNGVLGGVGGGHGAELVVGMILNCMRNANPYVRSKLLRVIFLLHREGLEMNMESIALMVEYLFRVTRSTLDVPCFNTLASLMLEVDMEGSMEDEKEGETPATPNHLGRLPNLKKNESDSHELYRMLAMNRITEHLDGSQVIRHPCLLRLIFKLCTKCPAQIGQEIVQQVIMLLANDQNKDMVLAMTGWQTLVIDIIRETYGAYTQEMSQSGPLHESASSSTGAAVASEPRVRRGALANALEAVGSAHHEKLGRKYSEQTSNDHAQVTSANSKYISSSSDSGSDSSGIAKANCSGKDNEGEGSKCEEGNKGDGGHRDKEQHNQSNKEQHIGRHDGVGGNLASSEEYDNKTESESKEGLEASHSRRRWEIGRDTRWGKRRTQNSFSAFSVVSAYALRVLHTLVFHGLKHYPQGSVHWQDMLSVVKRNPIDYVSTAIHLQAGGSKTYGVIPMISGMLCHIEQLLEREADLLLQMYGRKTSESGNSRGGGGSNGKQTSERGGRRAVNMASLLTSFKNSTSATGLSRVKDTARAILFLTTNALNVAMQTERALHHTLQMISEQNELVMKRERRDVENYMGTYERELESVWDCVESIVRVESWVWAYGNSVSLSTTTLSTSSLPSLSSPITSSTNAGASTSAASILQPTTTKQGADVDSEKALRRTLELVLRVAASTVKAPAVQRLLFASPAAERLCQILERSMVEILDKAGEDVALSMDASSNSDGKSSGGSSYVSSQTGVTPTAALAMEAKLDTIKPLLVVLMRTLTGAHKRQQHQTGTESCYDGDHQNDHKPGANPLSDAKNQKFAPRIAPERLASMPSASPSKIESKRGCTSQGYLLRVIAQVMLCGKDYWPLGLQKGLHKLKNDPSKAEEGAHAGSSWKQWEVRCCDKLLKNSTWVHYMKALERDDEVRKSVNEALISTRNMSAAADFVMKSHQERQAAVERKKRDTVDTLKNRVELAAKQRENEEAERRRHLETRESVSKRIRLHTLQHILRNLSNERGPWCPYRDTDREHGTVNRARRSPKRRRRRKRLFKVVKRPRVYWKMDKAEIPSGRIRAKLKIHYNGKSHEGCKLRTPADRQSSSTEQAKTRRISAEEEEESRVITKAIKVSLPLLAKGESSKQVQDVKLSTAKPEHKFDLVDLVKEDEELEDEIKQGDTKDSAATEAYQVSILVRVPCVMMTPAYQTPGFFMVTRQHVHFEVDEEKLRLKAAPSKWVSASSKKSRQWEKSLPQGYDRKWEVNSIRAIMFRRKKLRQTALEIFLENNTSCFFNFESQKVRRHVYRKVCSVLPDPDTASASVYTDIKESCYYFMYKKGLSLIESPAKLLEKSGFTKLWQERKISNFEYLMFLNTLAGRTYNDLSQYPVMPWVIKDYTSETINLRDPRVFRDLTLPIGAQKKNRLQQFLSRFNDWDQEMLRMPPFMYGTHYSSAGYVLFYMSRIEPYTSEHIRLQSGHFDNPNRMFHSIALAWEGCQTGFGDVRELIPEWYYQPEMFRNLNRYDMGTRDSGEILGDVIMPPWAKTPEEFTKISRDALESEHVSQHLHHWIDLIFGDKQQGPKAVKAFNVFCHYTYENAVDIDAIEDECERNSVLAQIEEFGQCPSQLFHKPHPRRFPPDTVDISVFSKLASMKSYVTKANVSSGRPVYIGVRGESVITIGEDRFVGVHKWKNASAADFIPPFSFDLERKHRAKHRRIGVDFDRGMAEDLDMRMFSASSDGKYIFSCGHWDNSFKVSLTESGRLVCSVVSHKDVVTCLALSRNSKVLVTGSKDTTVMVWSLDLSRPLEFLSNHPTHILYGHDDEVACVAVNVDMDVVISGSLDGTCIIFNLRSGNYVRSIYPPTTTVPIKWVGISSTGTIMTYSNVNETLHSYSVNGRLLFSADTKMQLNAFYFSNNGKFLVVCGSARGAKGAFLVLACHSLRVKWREETHDSIRAMALSPEEHHLLISMNDTSVMVYALNEAIMRKLTLMKLKMLGF